MTREPGGKLIKLGLVPVAGPSQADLLKVREIWKGQHALTTQAAYDANLTAFATWLRAEGRARVAGPRDVIQWLISQGKLGATATVITYLQGLLAQGRSPNTVKQHRSAISSAIDLCAEMGLIPWALKVRLPKGVERREERNTSGPAVAQFGAMLRAAAAHPWPLKAARDVALLRLITALRVRDSEVCRLRRVDWRNGAVRLKLKGHVTLIYVPAPAAARAAINAYLLLRGTVADDEPLFASCDPAGRTAGFLTRTGLYQVVRGLGRQAGITAIVSPHRLLHTASTALAELGVSTDRLQAWGRWEKRETAEVYIDNKPSVAAELAGVVDDMITKLLAEPL